MKKILIISNGPLCRNPRVFKEATTLGHVGYNVMVLTVRDHAPSEIHDAVLLKGAPFDRITVDLLPGLGASRARVFIRRLHLWAARKLAHFYGLQSIHSLGPARALLAAARGHPADLTIVHNEIAHWVGTKLIGDGRLVATDIEDWHSEDLLPAARRQRPLFVIRRVEQILLRRAIYTTTTSHALAAALHERYGGRAPAVLTNAFPLQPNFRKTPSHQMPSFFWFSQTIGPGRGLEPFIAAWALMQQPSRLVLLGELTSGFDHELLNQLPTEFVARITFLPLVPPDKLPALIAQHDIGLALEQSWIVNRDLTITNKILQYLNAGLAVVATPTAGQREVAAKASGAVSFINPESLDATARMLDQLIADPNRLAMAQRRARLAAETTYCWEQEAPRLVQVVAQALTAPLR